MPNNYRRATSGNCYVKAYPVIHYACKLACKVLNQARSIRIPCWRGIDIQACPQYSGTVVDLNCEGEGRDCIESSYTEPTCQHTVSLCSMTMCALTVMLLGNFSAVCISCSVYTYYQ